ncbi:S45A3-like protein [Mya arenaria]|uniref:S45A3-like protein n=1 Tax=Mya arenaria TaxID=6604 RepID=A0ABY7E7D3_MYAAR|nr:solute carrier family 45 member 3-like [Mya arenaria]XP_052801195.1 solute carrier family 45 member 3-like [Mya arenaria]WAR03056.1 S45A3-like protein [Mya arenaria]
MGLNDKDWGKDIRVRARTSSTEGMVPESIIPVLPTNIPIPEMVGIGLKGNEKKIGLLQIFLLNAVVCGVEICACAGFTYIPPMLLKAGYTEENMSIILGLGPLLGFFLVPIIGRASDRCRSKFGRRRPFIVGLSILLIMSLILIPYGEKLCRELFGTGAMAKSMTLLLLTMSVVLLDFTSQACLTPCEALLSDASHGTDQHERAFIVYSLMVSLGGFIGYLITALDWNATTIGLFFKTQERSVFSLLIILFALLLIATLIAARESPFMGPETVKNNRPKNEANDTLLEIGCNGGESGYDTNGSENGSKIVTPKDLPSVQPISRTPRYTASPKFGINSLLTCRLFAAICNLCRLIWINIHEKLPEPVQKLCEIPHVLRHLALAHFFSWTAVMGFNLFFTDFVANAVFFGNPNAPEDSELRIRFDNGVRMGSWGLLLHCITSAVYALFVEKIVARFGCRLTYSIGMGSFVFAMCGIVLFRSVMFVNLMAAMTGIAYATVTTIPYILVTKYHSDKQAYFFETPQVAARGVATDMATLDSAYFLAQVVLSCIMGYIVYMTGSVLSYMVTAGVMGVLSLYFIQNVITSHQDLNVLKQSLNVL